MSTDAQTLRLPLALGPAESVCRQAVIDLGWSYERLDGNLAAASEDPTRLHCHCHPLRAEIRLVADETGMTKAVISGKVPGFGLIASKHVREQTALLARRIGRGALRANRPAAAPPHRRGD